MFRLLFFTHLFQIEANKIAAGLGKTFIASNGWIDRFKKRHSIVFKVMHGDSADTDLNVVKTWKNSKLKTVIEDFDPDDVYNADETGLFFQCLPNKTFCFSNENCSSGKASKQRITVMVCSNSTGTDKRPLFMIGRSQNPRCFKKLPKKLDGTYKLPLFYRNNQKAWMTSLLFEEWLNKWDVELIKGQRKILLIVDNCSSHPPLNLKNITLRFLPPNTTAHTQPMDQGIINNLKVNYRKLLLQQRLECFEQNTDYTIDILTCIKLITKAWNNVHVTSIYNCFRKAGFHSHEEEAVYTGNFLNAFFV